MRRAVFVDTWGWLALGHRKDPQHNEIREVFRKLYDEGVHLYTSDYVLDELITLLFRREVFEECTRFTEGIFQGVDRGYLTIERITSERFWAAWRYRLQFQDKPRISFTDLTTMVVMIERGINRVLTEDEHFLQVGMGFQKASA